MKKLSYSLILVAFGIILGVTRSMPAFADDNGNNNYSQGPQGDPGHDGHDGADGHDGHDGSNGHDGVQGDKGDTGLVGTIQGNGGTSGSATNASTLNLIGNGIAVTQEEGTANADFSNLTTNQGNSNTTAINNEAATRAEADTTLQNNINSESDARASGDANLQGQVNSANGRIDAVNNRVDALDHRIGELEETKYVGELGIRLYDAKRFSLVMFDAYDFRHSANFMVGVRGVIKLGKSYEEKRLDKLEAELKRQGSLKTNSIEMDLR